MWLFSLVLGFSRLIWARFVVHQDLPAVLRCHASAFEALGGVPCEILYDRIKTAVIGECEAGGIVYNRSLVDLARHYGFHPKACQPYRAKTKGKVERPFRYIREDFFLARSFRNLDDLNAPLRHWLDTVANPRVHATTRRVVNEAFVEDRTALRPLPLAPFRSVLKLERRISREGMVSVGGNFYSVPVATRRRVVEVHSLADEIRIFEEPRLRRMGRCLRRSRRRHRLARPAAAPCLRRPDRRLQLPAEAARRTPAGTPAVQSSHHATVDQSGATGHAEDHRRIRNAPRRTEQPHWGILLRHFWG